ncbi:hypothetical protein MMC25_001395 [Agyrium rufum]|nr:hypothetical protein [Agyrium rufum]
MTLAIGQDLHGRKASYKLLEILKDAFVFKAEIISAELKTACPAPKWVVIKAEPLDDKWKSVYDREVDNHGWPPFVASPYIRSLKDHINHDIGSQGRRSIVLEWFETDLWKARAHKRCQEPEVQRQVAKSVLEALAVFADNEATHTDINPNNVLISDLESPLPTVKVADLENLCFQGFDEVRAQGLEIRAPEVWRGLGCWPSSDVWSLGVTMLHWLAQKTIFGAGDKVVKGLTDSWCIAKIKRLVGPLGSPVKPEYEDDFKHADFLEQRSYQIPDMHEMQKFIKVGTVRQEMEKLPIGVISKHCMDFIESLLLIDHTKRPTAREALQHPFITGRV